MRREFLEKRKTKLLEKRDALKDKALASNDINEVRSINEKIDEINEAIEDVNAELEAIAADDQRSASQDDFGSRQTPPANATKVNGNVVGSYGTPATATQSRENNDPFATLEYRKAFMKYAQTGEAIPANLYQRDGMPANTGTLGATIPTTTLNEFINEIRKVYGNLYSKVRKLNIQGGVKIPISQLQATFKWITEDTVSPRQDGGNINETVEFSFNAAEIRVSQTLLSSIVTLDVFEREIVRIMMIAYLQAMDTGIVKGTGNGQMLGILNDPRVLATNNVVTMNSTELNSWIAWRQKFFAKLPLGYRFGEFIFPLGTVDAYLETMADANGNPIFRQATGLEVNDGDSRNPNGRFFGREIALVEPDIIPDFDNAQVGDVIGIFWQPDEYAINTNMEFGMRRWFDEDRNEWVNKMLTIVDGKVLNPKGYWLIKKGADETEG
jgi:HK97 family phage major capsid protein